MRRPKTRTVLIFITLLPGLVFSCARAEKPLEWSELRPILKQCNLKASEPLARHREVTEIEEVDSRLYAPIVGKTIFLESPSPTFDSEGLKPRYWLRVEDYQTAETAAKRAAEYNAVGTYERIEKAYGKGTRHSLSKLSVRQWAIARGKRVYALTTDTNLFTLIKTPETLRKSIAMLPET